ncbi:ABC transporter ATP-binding protein [Nonomuraea roseoviolacea]|uniref:ABC-2 type transport system ATP-binding protein n=1 Tax=Nonomuraea roseoviolacea subsp. carminata TaxID=160689 RepID=A0ABT1K8C9_9ACTN|nr:ABC transporter ATP-binding protein [Nonomuraea roseoviolacea]MCP2350249.1 ABC-2 type transport system ATP-binding protein [Nonomuraea roseoviolacea subsp. carminata]
MTNTVTFTGVSKSYGRVRALDDVTFHVAQGETVALLGPNGAGKSTSVDLMLGLAKPDRGTIGVLGTEPGRAVAQGRVGAMLQSGGLPADTSVADVVTLAVRLHGGRRAVAEVLELAGLTSLARRGCDELSGGQAQRVRFAVAMAGQPELLFLDEPTVAMDVESRRAFWTAVRASGTTTVFATHYLEEADAHADRVIVMAGGKVVASGTPSTIKAMAGARTIRCVLDSPDPARLLALPGVLEVEVHGDDVTLRAGDADRAVAALYSSIGGVRDLHVTGADLEDALIKLTSARN